MKQLLAVTLLWWLPQILFAQVLTGKVYGYGTDSTVANASIYYSGSTTGTLSAGDGSFYLQAKGNQVPLIISCVGYYTEQVTNPLPGKILRVYLKLKLLELQGVTVSYDGMSLEDKVRLFTREFIGTSKYAKSCTIENIDEVDLHYNRNTQTLTAECSKPLIISNKMLAYSITYYLDHFKRTNNNISFAGNYIFKDVSTPTGQKTIACNRADVYEGSRMQFIRALWSRSLKSTGFKLYRNDYTRLTEDSIIARDSAREQYLYLGRKVLITQNAGGMLAYTTLTPVTKFSYIDKDGFYGIGIRWSGKLGYQRVGDLLPFEYQSEEKTANKGGDYDDQINAAFNDERIAAAVESAVLSNKKGLKLFKDIVLGKGFVSADQQFVRKWQRPVYYKVYGGMNDSTANQALKYNIQQFFKRIAGHAGLTIEPVTTDSLVNFSIILGDVKKYYSLIEDDAKVYFTTHKNSTGYSNYSPNGISRTVQKIAIDGFTLQLTWMRVRSQILNGLGFMGKVYAPAKSLFYDGVYTWAPGKPFEDFDVEIIKALYGNAVRPGMEEADLESLKITPKLNNE